MPGKVTDDPSTTTHRGRSAPHDAPRRRPSADLGESLFPAVEGGVRKLYTVPMMAAVLRVPVAAVRHWVRGGLLAATKRASAIEWFDFQQLVIGRQLGRFLAAGLSLREIDAQLQGLMPGGAPAAARVAERIVIDGRRLNIRRNGRLLGSGGQLQFGFVSAGGSDPCVAALTAPRPDPVPERVVTGMPAEHADLLDLAADLEAAGEFAEAAEALRAFLQAEGPAPQVVFMLAELLYRSGDLTAARERYYATLELDADHLEARTSLGCVLAELGEHELSLAALEGVLRQEPDYADAHWHIAGVLHECGRKTEARRHLRTFLTLAPESPWAALARDRLR